MTKPPSIEANQVEESYVTMAEMEEVKKSMEFLKKNQEENNPLSSLGDGVSTNTLQQKISL